MPDANQTVVADTQTVSPSLAKRFLRAFIRAAQKKNQAHQAHQATPHAGHASGAHLKEIPHHIYSFQKDVMQHQPSPHLLRDELNELQRKINLALNQEKYISTIQEQENAVIGSMEPPFHTLHHAVDKKLAAIQTSEADFPVPTVPVHFPFPSSEQMPVREPTVQERMITQVEHQLAVVEQYAARLGTHKSADKAQLLRIKKLIRQHQKKLKQLKRKYAAA